MTAPRAVKPDQATIADKVGQRDGGTAVTCHAQRLNVIDCNIHSYCVIDPGNGHDRGVVAVSGERSLMANISVADAAQRIQVA